MTLSPHMWRRTVLWAVGAVLLLLAVVLVAKGVRATSWGREFVASYTGGDHQGGQPVQGFPWWLRWQHFLNVFFLVTIVRSGWLIRRTARPRAYWQRRNVGWLTTKNSPARWSIDQWFHVAVNILWVLNGLLYVVMLLASGQWRRIVPQSWDVVPEALSVLLQYASLDWPTTHGWVSYNALQVLAYGVTVFLAAPLAIVTGVRISPGLRRWGARFDGRFPLRIARKLHVVVVVYFLVFTAAHVTLVLATGMRANLNGMYAGRDADDWVGFGVFAVSVVFLVVAWVLARPLLFRFLANLSGKVTR